MQYVKEFTNDFNNTAAGRHWGWGKQKSAFEHTQNVRIYIILHMRKVSSYLCFPFIYSVVSNDSSSGQWRPWSDCPDVQADLGFHYQHMPKDMFWHGAAHLMDLNLTAV